MVTLVTVMITVLKFCFLTPPYLKHLLSAVFIQNEAMSLLSSEIKTPVEILCLFERLGSWPAKFGSSRVSGPPNIYLL